MGQANIVPFQRTLAVVWGGYFYDGWLPYNITFCPSFLLLLPCTTSKRKTTEKTTRKTRKEEKDKESEKNKEKQEEINSKKILYNGNL